ncbi:MAG TPA: phage holin family protein [Candidatus Elarobacter sp.]|nr:phage holin family protein [Candidatus Elarobacter sp.]
MAAPSMRQGSADRSLGDLLRELSDGTAQLLRQEIQLARTETVESLLGLKRGTVLVGTGIALALCAAGATIAFLVLALSRCVLGGRTWLAALVVAVVLDLAAWLCVRRGAAALSAKRIAPHETATSIRDTARWLKHPTRSVTTSS